MNKNVDDGKGILRHNRHYLKIIDNVKTPHTAINIQIKTNPTPCQTILLENAIHIVFFFFHSSLHDCQKQKPVNDANFRK